MTNRFHVTKFYVDSTFENFSDRPYLFIKQDAGVIIFFLVSSPHSVYDFPRKIFFMLYSIN